MKKLSKLFILAALGLASCKKATITVTPLSSFNVTNAVVGGATLYLNTSAEDSVTNNSYTAFSLITGQSRLGLYTAANPGAPYYNQTIPTVNGSYYSLFLSGASPANVDNVLIKESYKNYTDSLCGVRFINLSPGSQPISVDIAGNANGSEVASLAYKAYSIFKQYPAKVSTPTYTFEFRDATTGNLITTYTLNTPYFHNVTLCFAALEANATIIQDNDF